MPYYYRSGFLEGRKYRMAIGEMGKVLTDKLEHFCLGGNKQITGNLHVLNLCVMLTHVDLSKCGVHGEISALEKCTFLEHLDLSDSKVRSQVVHLKD